MPKTSAGGSVGGWVRWVQASYKAASSRVKVAPWPSMHLATQRHAAQVGPVSPHRFIASSRVGSLIWGRVLHRGVHLVQQTGRGGAVLLRGDGFQTVGGFPQGHLGQAE